MKYSKSKFLFRRKTVQNPKSKRVGNWNLAIGHWSFKRHSPGQVMIIALIFLLVILVLASSLFSRLTNFLRFGSKSIQTEQAVNAAEAGIDYTLWKLNTSGSYAGESNIQVGTSSTFTTTVTNVSENFKKIVSTGYVPNATNPKAKRTIKVDALISGTIISFNYAAQVGNGGVDMSNSSTINGAVYTNGSITGSQSSSILGDAYAVGTISTPPQVTGTKFPNSPPTEMPPVDYDEWRDKADDGGTVDCSLTPNLCNIVANQSIGPKKYIGNLNITNNAVVTVNGAIWVTGNLSVTQGGTKVNLADTLGSYGTAMIVEGTVSISQGGAFNPNNANPKGYILVITTYSVAGVEAMEIRNSGVNAIFYALDGEASLENTAQVTALVAKKLILRNSASLTYQQGLASSQFTSGPGGAWTIKKGTYRFTTNP